eukprot:1362995-Amphidinium_carterae.1
MVGLMKSSCRRLLVSARMTNSFWPYAVQVSAQKQQAHVLGYEWNLPVFGELVAKRLLWLQRRVRLSRA